MAIWIIKHSPRSDPKFHQLEILDGAGKSTKALFIILNKGWVFRIGLFILIYDFGRNGPSKMFVIFTVAINVKKR